ncbi:MAG TPA: ORF6N domain-containing protein [Burkholderiales bacterium]|nr:ORF6N domain-containing protein [Burkholderiales bacterium]
MGEDHGEQAPRIIRIRGRRVVVDADLAKLYGVPTKRLNEAVKRNRARFPQEFAFQLTPAELAGLKSQNNLSASELVDSQDNNENRSQIATGSQKHRDPRHKPWVFTEHGVLMAANVLGSSRATEMSVFVIRAFIRLREQVAANSAILQRLAEIDATLLQHDSALRDIYRKLLPLLQPPPDPPKRRIGFHSA